MEEVWRRSGGALGEVWRRSGGGLEELWRRCGGGLQSVKCVTVVKNRGSMGVSKSLGRKIDQLCFAASIGEVRNCRQKWVVSKSLGRTSINCVSLLRSVKCVTVVKNGWCQNRSVACFLGGDQSLGRTSNR